MKGVGHSPVVEHVVSYKIYPLGGPIPAICDDGSRT